MRVAGIETLPDAYYLMDSARNQIVAAIREARRKEVRWWQETLIPSLSLLVALAIFTTQCGSAATSTQIVVHPENQTSSPLGPLTRAFLGVGPPITTRLSSAAEELNP